MPAIEFADCPKMLRDEVEMMISRFALKVDLIAVEKSESTPFKDKTAVVTTYKVYLQYGYEIGIYKISETIGGSALDGHVSSEWVNGADIMTIAKKAKWIGNDLRELLSKEGPNGTGRV